MTNSASDLSSFDASTLTVTYEAVMLDDAATLAQDYWVSVGAEYNNENDVWVGQASLTADTSTPADVSLDITSHWSLFTLRQMDTEREKCLKLDKSGTF